MAFFGYNRLVAWLKNPFAKNEKSAVATDGEVDSVNQIDEEVVEVVVCTEWDCQEEGIFICQYMDSRANVCNTSWCKTHTEDVGERHFCRRHSGVVTILNAQDKSGTTTRRIIVPNVEDRSLSLLDYLYTEVNETIMGMLRTHHIGEAVTGIDPDPAPIQVAEKGRHTGWETGWASYTHAGWIQRFTIRVKVGEPPVVELRSFEKVIFSGIPDWITDRSLGEAGHALFADKLYRAITVHLNFSKR